MKTIFKIAKTELQVLFYSPVAWLILVIFTFQSAIIFSELYEQMVRWQSLGRELRSLTRIIFTDTFGFFTRVQTYLYLYIPLLTMGIMSREYASGSIKLLYSSPLTNYQIIFGKYLSLVVYAMVLVGVLSIFGLYSVLTIDHVDVPLILSGLLGLFLLICAYAAIGLFMSSLTSYTVVAAMGTLAMLAMLTYVKDMWQDIEFVRDVTYWLAISGRVDTFISGLLTSEDFLYYLIVIGLFIGFCIVKLQAGRQKSSWVLTFGKYAAIFFVCMLVGFLSAKPNLKSYYDVTRTKTNTLTVASQEVMKKLDGKLTIHTYVNMLEQNYHNGTPTMYKYDVDRFKQYIRFKPDLQVKYHYYYHKGENPTLDKQYPDLNDKQRLDTINKLYNWKFPIQPYDSISENVDLNPEDFRFVRQLEYENGRKTFLRIYNDPYVHPFESEITAAFKRLVVNKFPVVGFLTGHGERMSSSETDRGYNMVAQEKTFRYALINQGFDFTDVTLEKKIPENIRILVVAEPKEAFTADEQANLNQYLARGGNLIIAGEPRRQAHLNKITESIGVRFLPGIIVKPSDQFQSDLLILKPTKEGIDFSHHLETMSKRKQVLTMPTLSALEYDSDRGFDVTTLFRSDSTGSWNETETTDFVDDSATINRAVGEVERSYPTVLALSRKVNGRNQRILVTGDSDWLSNAELGMSRNEVRASNFSLISAAFFWLSDNEVPIDMRRDPSPDTSMSIGEDGWAISKIFLKWILPVILMAIGVLIWIRRRGR